MTEKEILLSDLLARIPYNVKVSIDGGRPIVLTFGDLDAETYNTSLYDSIRMKLYLRPMSSMTEEEKKEFIYHASYEIEESVNGRHYEYYLKDYVGTPEKPTCNPDAIDWLNANHFDYRGLIKKGLALEAPEGMYRAKSGIPKDPNILGIKDEFDKDEVMGVLGEVYDFWKAKETENVRNGCGRSGLDGMTTVDVWRLFNQMLVVLSCASAHVEPDTSYKCSCGADLVSESVVLTSYPPQHPYLCPKCGKRYVYGQSGRYSWDETSGGLCDTVNYTFSKDNNDTLIIKKNGI